MREVKDEPGELSDGLWGKKTEERARMTRTLGDRGRVRKVREELEIDDKLGRLTVNCGRKRTGVEDGLNW